MLLFELLERELLLASHDAIVECNHEVFALLCLFFTLLQLTSEEIDRALVGAVKELGLRHLCQLAGRQVAIILEGLRILKSFRVCHRVLEVTLKKGFSKVVLLNIALRIPTRCAEVDNLLVHILPIQCEKEQLTHCRRELGST